METTKYQKEVILQLESRVKCLNESATIAQYKEVLDFCKSIEAKDYFNTRITKITDFIEETINESEALEYIPSVLMMIEDLRKDYMEGS